MIMQLTKDRKLIGIITDDFSLKLNGKSNQDYVAILKPLGIRLEFVNEVAEEPVQPTEVENEE